jgi:hypothetical protein
MTTECCVPPSLEGVTRRDKFAKNIHEFSAATTPSDDESPRSVFRSDSPEASAIALVVVN